MHEDIRFFRDGDRLWGFCFDCGAELEPARYTMAMYAANTIASTAAIRSSCQHEFSYYTLGASSHHVICGLCGYAYIESHSIVSADCANAEHCGDCGHHELTWDEALGHDMGYECDFVNGTHTLRCMRADNDMQYICDHVEESDLPCLWGYEYVDGETDGEHYRWQDCTTCGNMNYIGSYPCTYPNCLYPH